MPFFKRKQNNFDKFKSTKVVFGFWKFTSTGAISNLGFKQHEWTSQYLSFDFFVAQIMCTREEVDKNKWNQVYSE